MDNTDKPGNVLPLARIKSIMKCRGASKINKEALFLMTKCTELFVKDFARAAHETSKKNGDTDMIKYEHLSQLVDNSKKYEFLFQYMPEKISMQEFKKILSSGDDDDDTDDENGAGAESKD